MLNITIAQLNPTIGDISSNLALIKDAAQKAEDSHLVVFPELVLTGYYPADLFEDAQFKLRLAEGHLELLALNREFPSQHWVVGVPVLNPGAGKKWLNQLWVLHQGQLCLAYSKQLLPTYNVFDERRHFEPGPDVACVLCIRGVHVGLLICEDGWNQDQFDYSVNPFNRLKEAAVDVVVSINASPSHVGKREQRHAIFSKASSAYGFSIVYVNQIGGHDQLVFDGSSFVVDPSNGVVFEAPAFEPFIGTISYSAQKQGFSPPVLPRAPGLSPAAFYHQQIVLGLRDYARRCGFSTAVVGCSGGVDSALTLALAVDAFGPDNVTAITMPSDFSSVGSVTDSQQLCKNLGIRLYEHPIKSIVSIYCTEFANAFGSPPTGLTLENLQARVRGTMLMEYSNAFGHLLLTTGNKSELAIGYYTLFGDSNGGLGPIGDLYKTEIFQLCEYLNWFAGEERIPLAIIQKPPSAELAPGQKDTDTLPPYPVLDNILKYLLEFESLSSAELTDVAATLHMLNASGQAELVSKIRGMLKRSEYKRRQAAPILRVRARAFGSGRQYPIAATY
ncbi:MAG: NAD+ synthase [Agitococcus sp.]|nr:NAD+ synthase [Agitococcus sp.]